MPERRYKRGCGPECIRCWVNRLKHGNKEAKAYLLNHPELNWEVKHDNEEENQPNEVSVPSLEEEKTVDATETLKRIKEQRKLDDLQRKRLRELRRSYPEEYHDDINTLLESN